MLFKIWPKTAGNEEDKMEFRAQEEELLWQSIRSADQGKLGRRFVGFWETISEDRVE
jgi:hypothetical protein